MKGRLRALRGRFGGKELSFHMNDIRHPIK